ncbi:ABC-type bacteriocin/lantibiotic exporter with double-glycine peptidase domain [Aequitasia blattaphilus]|uniref:ABC transporter ATP-binding protein/permease n=1 Tax=Aequitasia blattaphilus TaxID=2949332 RepID=A0ABT1EBY7_9FIRM|nr:ABC transporter ATP-binding protein [Aequitasia blattaphilus]MCP1103354.1 ABC transporter ATP-binding protein/permease [Aequitasia blattaphilus]MCR8615994.1 ABC transporter ATP-binding protein/permease [Aequitasia blattaphilus]
MSKVYRLFLKKYILMEKKYFVLVCLVTVLQSMVTMCIPLTCRTLLDNAFPNKNTKLFVQMVVIMLLCYFFVAGLNVAKDYLLAKIAEGLSYRLRTELNNKISVMKYSYFDENSLSDILSKYNKEVDTIKENCGYMLIKSLSNIVTFIMASIMILSMDWRVMVISVVLLVFYIMNNKFWGVKVKDLAEKSMKWNEKALSSLAENYTNVLITKIYSAYEYVNQKFKEIYSSQYRNQIKLEVVYSVNINSGGLLIYLLAAFIWLLGGFSVISGQLTVGAITALINYQGMLVSPMSFFAEFNNSYQSTVIAMKRLYSVLAYEEEEEKGIQIEEDKISSIRFNDVDFEYIKGSSVLEKINVELKQGEVAAFIGGSGCGKSSMVKMILRLYDPKEGEILINNQKINDLSVKTLRDRIAFVAQESLFYEGSIIENINIGNKRNHAKQIEYSKLLDLYEEIDNLPDKWNTVLNSGTSNLSGGQKKRLDVLRALLKESDILIFDESTASIDVERRKLLFQLVDKIKKDKIVVFITHNIEECKFFDNIYAVKNKTVQQVNLENVIEAY